MTFGWPTNVTIFKRYRDRFPNDDVIFAHALTPDNIGRVEAALEAAISRGAALTVSEAWELGLGRTRDLPPGALT